MIGVLQTLINEMGLGGSDRRITNVLFKFKTN